MKKFRFAEDHPENPHGQHESFCLTILILPDGAFIGVGLKSNGNYFN